MKRRAKIAAELAELITISHAVGADPDLVQGGGGNTSVKTRDGKTIFVKASGTALSAMTEKDGWVALDLEAARDLLTQGRLLKLPAAEREAQVLHLLLATVRSPLGARPSVESSLHALLDRVVIHTHPVHLNAFLCARDSREAYRELLPRLGGAPLYLPYVDPGYVLGVRLRTEVERYAQDHGKLPAVVLLENHGLFVAAAETATCLNLLTRVTKLARRNLGTSRVNPVTFSWVSAGAGDAAAPASGRISSSGARTPRRKARRRREDTRADIRSLAAELRGALLRAGCAALLLRRDDSPLAAEFAHRPDAVSLARQGAFTPDQIVYSRTCPVVIRDQKPATWERAIDRYRARFGVDPRVIVRPGDGVYYAAPTLAELRVVAEVYRGAMLAILRNNGSGVRFLSRRQAKFIENWEVESFRAQLLSHPHAPLSGRVAVITGAASGLGKGIARGLAAAGATVLAFDIDGDMLEETRREFAAGQFLPVVVDVTDEESVARAVSTVEAAVGGADILVNAAGIAPSFPLVDFPLGAWQKTLDINLTGYFLCAREVARLLLRQNAGGSIVNLTSKSGLDASKSNSAYNATKAGEIHLMRGWALELGPAGIRVNCVAPGNVFQGSQIWNEEYIRAAAKKQGIRPEEVIPYYVSLSPLGEEIEPRDVASCVLYLVSDEGRKVTGQTLVVDGGQVMVR